MQVNLEKLGEIILRTLSKGRRYHGTVIIKFYDGNIASVKAEDSYNIEYLKNLNLEIDIKE